MRGTSGQKKSAYPFADNIQVAHRVCRLPLLFAPRIAVRSPTHKKVSPDSQGLSVSCEVHLLLFQLLACESLVEILLFSIRKPGSQILAVRHQETNISSSTIVTTNTKSQNDGQGPSVVSHKVSSWLFNYLDFACWESKLILLFLLASPSEVRLSKFSHQENYYTVYTQALISSFSSSFHSICSILHSQSQSNELKWYHRLREKTPARIPKVFHPSITPPHHDIHLSWLFFKVPSARTPSQAEEVQFTSVLYRLLKEEDPANRTSVCGSGGENVPSGEEVSWWVRWVRWVRRC